MLTRACLCQQCDQLVEQYEPLLVQLLLQMLDPDFVCMVNKINSELNNKTSNVNTLSNLPVLPGNDNSLHQEPFLHS